MKLKNFALLLCTALLLWNCNSESTPQKNELTVQLSKDPIFQTYVKTDERLSQLMTEGDYEMARMEVFKLMDKVLYEDAPPQSLRGLLSSGNKDLTNIAQSILLIKEMREQLDQQYPQLKELALKEKNLTYLHASNLVRKELGLEPLPTSVEEMK